jgi:Uma2 family endonuclease
MLRSREMDSQSEARGRKLTYDDFLHFPDDGQRHELIDGVHYVTPSPLTIHQRLVRRLLVSLDAYLSATGRGEAFAAPLDAVMSNHDVVEPDLLVVLEDQRRVLTAANVQGAPAIVIEVLSHGTRKRDRGVKRALYERAGVREYWLVDPERSSIVQCARNDRGTLVTIAELHASADATLRSDLLPDFALALTRLFSAA